MAESSSRKSIGWLVSLLVLCALWTLGGMLWKARLLEAHKQNYEIATAYEALASWIPGADATTELRQNNEFKARYENLMHSSILTAAWHSHELWSFAGQPSTMPTNSQTPTANFRPLEPFSYEANWTQGSGVEIVKVAPSTPAAQAGLRPGDVITCYNGSAINSETDFQNATNPQGTVVLDNNNRSMIIVRSGAKYLCRVPFGRLDISVKDR